MCTCKFTLAKTHSHTQHIHISYKCTSTLFCIYISKEVRLSEEISTHNIQSRKMVNLISSLLHYKIIIPYHYVYLHVHTISTCSSSSPTFSTSTESAGPELSLCCSCCSAEASRGRSSSARLIAVQASNESAYSTLYTIILTRDSMVSS